jgi:carbon-monoxide dehydrogenase medium subunit
MHTFAYHRAATASDASRLFGALEDARYLAGGQSLLPMMKLRFAQSANIVDLRDVSELRGVVVSPDDVTIGALTRHVDVADCIELKVALPSLAGLAAGIGDRQVRAQGTIGGSLANNDPAADYPAACLALDATVVTLQRAIPADQFFHGVFETALDEGELISAVRFRRPDAGAYAKFRHPASRFALAGAFVAKFAGEVRVAIAGAGSQGVFRWAEAEAALDKSFTEEVVEGLLPDYQDFNDDMHGSAEYRAHLVKVMVRRAVRSMSPGAD